MTKVKKINTLNAGQNEQYYMKRSPQARALNQLSLCLAAEQAHKEMRISVYREKMFKQPDSHSRKH